MPLMQSNVLLDVRQQQVLAPGHHAGAAQIGQKLTFFFEERYPLTRIESLPAAKARPGRWKALTFRSLLSAEELTAAIGLEPRHTYSGRHLEPL